jgi:tRNA U34 5-methylaminomethyl-2-thiouridine-forming methyltransferase MnmC
MPIPERERIASGDPRFLLVRTDDGSLTVEEVATGDTFHSGCGAVTECAQVYAENSGIVGGFRDGRPQAVLEIGFGTGLAFLVTAALANHYGGHLSYYAIDRRKLSIDLTRRVLRGAVGIDPVLDQTSSAVIAAMEDILVAFQRSDLNEPIAQRQITERIELTLQYGDAVEQKIAVGRSFDAIYFDPFHPDSNQEMWSEAMLVEMYRMLVPGGRLVSYCVKSDVRRMLRQIGFDARRVPGPPGGKREVLVAIKGETNV